MGIRFPSSVTPDHDNYSLFGKAWKDRSNGVTELSAQIGSGGRNLEDDAARHMHQHKLLAARLNTFLDEAATPVVATRMAIGNTEIPYLKAPLISLRDARVLPSFSSVRHASMKSFNESKASSKLVGDYLRCDEHVRSTFLEKIEIKISQLQNNRKVRTRLEQLHGELSRLSEKKVKDLDALKNRKDELRSRKADAAELTGRDKMLAQTKLFLKRTNGELRSLERKTNEILTPSSYELHRADNNGEKVSNRPLHVEELKQRALGKSSGPVGDLRSKIDIRNFAETQFDSLADAMRHFHELLHSESGVRPADEQALRNAAKPILYSGDREAVHRFIHDMTRQLKRAGIESRELDEINALIPGTPGASQKLMQATVPGTGKQMRLQDEAERMAKALPKVLTLTAQHAEQLKSNLMQFDLSGVKALSDYVDGKYSDYPKAVEFIKSSQGKAFVDALIKKGIERFGPHYAPVRRFNEHRGPSDPRHVLNLTLDLLHKFSAVGGQPDKPSLLLPDLIQENQHLFMVTSDAEFWEREAVDKVGTRLVADQDINAKDKSRIFKQMKMRAAAMGMSKEDIDAFMIQGITNTLRNRNMAVVGTKVGGVVGSVAGNISSTPLSAAAAPYAPFLAVPGIMDIGLMPAGWAVGLGPGALVGATVLNSQKKARLKEGKDSGNVVQIRFDGNWGQAPATQKYTAASKKLSIGGERLVMREDVQKTALRPSFKTGGGQFGHAHAQVWKGMARDISSALWKPVRYAFYDGIKDAWKDLVIHNEPNPDARRKPAYSPAFTSAAMESRTASATPLATPSVRTISITERPSSVSDLRAASVSVGDSGVVIDSDTASSRSNSNTSPKA